MDLKIKTRVINCTCEGCKRKVKSNVMQEASKSSCSVKSGSRSERSPSGTSRAGSHKSHKSVKSGGEAQSQKGSKAPSVASMENKSVKTLDLTDLESKRSGKSKVSEKGGSKKGGKGGLFGFGKLFSSGKNGGGTKSQSEKAVESVHGGSIHGSGAAQSVAGSSRAGSKKSSKKSTRSHHSGEKRSQMGDPWNRPDLTAAMYQQTAGYYDGFNRPMSPPKHQRESCVHYFSDENANACNVM